MHARLGPSKEQMRLAGNSERKKPVVSVWPDGECSSSSEREQRWETKRKNEPLLPPGVCTTKGRVQGR